MALTAPPHRRKLALAPGRVLGARAHSRRHGNRAQSGGGLGSPRFICAAKEDKQGTTQLQQHRTGVGASAQLGAHVNERAAEFASIFPLHADLLAELVEAFFVDGHQLFRTPVQLAHRA